MDSVPTSRRGSYQPSAPLPSRRALREAAARRDSRREPPDRQAARRPPDRGAALAAPQAATSWPILAAALVVGGLLRLTQLGTESLWVDEGYTAQLIRFDPVDYIRNVLHTIRNILPPFYFALMHYWTELAGTSEVALRLPSALAGIAAIALVYRFALVTLGPRAAAIAAVLLALSPFHIWYSQEARPYELLALLFLLALYFLVQVLEQPRQGPIVGLAVANALMLYTHHHGTILLASEVLYVGLLALTQNLGRQALRRLTRSALWLAVACLPWVVLFVDQLGKVNEFPWLHRPTLGSVDDVLVAFAGSRWTLICLAALIGYGAYARRDLIDGLGSGPRWDRPARTYLLLWTAFALPLALTFAYSVVFTPVFGPKYVIACSLPLLILAADGAARAPGKLVGAALTAVTVAGAAVPLFRYYTEVDKEQWREATAYVERYSAPGDLVLFNAGYTLASGFDTYATRTDLDTRPFPLGSADFASMPTAADLAQLAELSRGHKDVWIVYSQSPDSEFMISQVLSALSSKAYCRNFVGVSACGYVMKTP